LTAIQHNKDLKENCPPIQNSQLYRKKAAKCTKLLS